MMIKISISKPLILGCTQRQSLRETPSSSAPRIGRAARLEFETMRKATFVDSTCGPASAYGYFTRFRDDASSDTTHGLTNLLKLSVMQACGDRSAWTKISAWCICPLSCQQAISMADIVRATVCLVKPSLRWI